MPYPYATQDDLIRHVTLPELIALSNLSDAAAGTVDESVVAQALAGAADEIDAYLGERYDLTVVHAIAPAPPLLVKFNCVIARKDLDSMNTREAVLEAYRDAVRFLQQVAKGLATLNLATTEPTSPPSGGVAYRAPAPAFTRDTLRGYGL